MSRDKTNDRRFWNFAWEIIRAIGIFLHILPKVAPHPQVTYSKSTPPPDYKCGRCKATNCKLWRQWGTSNLLCFKCVAQENCLPTVVCDTLDDAGSVIMNGKRSSFIDHSYGGWLDCTPGVPAPNGGWHNIFNLDPGSIRVREWWQQLPSLPK